VNATTLRRFPSAAIARLGAKTPITTDRVRRVLIVGASSIQFYLGSELERFLLSFYDDVEVLRFGKLSTGLARTDLLDWPQKITKLMEEFRPDLVIGNFGGNDAQNMLVSGGAVLRYGTPEWDREYRFRVRRVVEVARARRAKIAMLGMPIMRDPGFSRRMAHVNRLTLEGVREGGGVFIPTWDLAAESDGTYRKAVVIDGETGLMRLPDGIHYSRLGAKYVAKQVGQELERYVVLVPRDEGLSIAARRSFASHSLGNDVSYVAYVPKTAAPSPSGWPVLILWHGAEGPWLRCAEQAHRHLQELSTRHHLVVVVPVPADEEIDAARLFERDGRLVLRELVADVAGYVGEHGPFGIFGWSADGYEAVRLAVQQSDLFASASSMGRADEPSCSPWWEEPARTEDTPSREITQRGLLLADRADARPLPMLITTFPSSPPEPTFDEHLSVRDIDLTLAEEERGNEWPALVTELARHVAWHASELAGRRAQ
jgi:hypothetical protein